MLLCVSPDRSTCKLGPKMETRWNPVCCLWLLLLFHCLWRNVLALSCDETFQGLVNSEGQILAPSFPSSYPREGTFYKCTYTLRNLNASGVIRLVFDDVHLDDQVQGTFENRTRDYLQIDLKDGTVPEIKNGVNRPPTILSPGREVVVTLGVQADRPGTYSGPRTFSASYSFITAAKKNNLQNIYSDTRTVIPTVSLQQGNVAYTVLAPLGYLSGIYSGLEIDIIWYIEAEAHMNILLIIKDFTKSDTGDTSSLEVRDGLTSAAAPLYVARMAQDGYELVSSQEQLFVRWKGPTGVEASFQAQFTFFIKADSGMQCPGDYFTCRNERCVLQQLTCNMRDNCGDDSDEDSTGVCKGRTTTSPACAPMCLSGGLCINGLCECLEGFYGELCQNRNSSNTDFTDLQHTSIMIGAFVGAVCLLSVCWLIAMARKRYQDEPQQGGHLSRIVSIHTPEEVGLRRNTTVVGEQDIPPDYNLACRRDSRRGSLPKRYRPSIDSMGPLSPPPSYEIVTGELEVEPYTGLQFRMPLPDVNEERNLPDVVNSDQASPEPPQQQTVMHETEIHEEPQPAQPSTLPQMPPTTTAATTATRVSQDTLV